MKGGISVHVVDVASGRVASGMRIEIHSLDPPALICDARTDEHGILPSPALAGPFRPGRFEARFHIADYYRAQNVVLAEVPFLDVSVYRFGIASKDQHYHLPLKMTPWGYSLFRGGA